MPYNNPNYTTPRTDWLMLMLVAAGTLTICALLYAPPAYWRALLS